MHTLVTALRQMKVTEVVSKSPKNLPQLIPVCPDREFHETMDHVPCLREVLYKAIQTPHEVIGDQVKATALPVDQHGRVGFLQVLLHFLEQEVVQLGVPVDQSGQVLDVPALQGHQHSEEELAELGQNLSG